MELEMKHRWFSRGSLAAALSAALLSGAATADDTGDLTVQATVSNTCVVSDATLDFGTVLATAPNNDASTAISWACTPGFSTTIELGNGLNGNRTLDAVIAYELYSDSGHTSVWGGAGQAVAVTGTGFASMTDTTVYGRILGSALNSVSPGTYDDTVTITIKF
jgi:spore coat protein U-like protein